MSVPQGQAAARRTREAGDGDGRVGDSCKVFLSEPQ